MSKKHLLGLILFLAGLILAGCSSAAPNAASNSSTAAPQSFSCTVRIGASLSATGNYVTEGKWVHRGYDMWVDWVNNEYGGIKVGDKRCKAQIIYYDDESNPDTSAKLVEKLITQDKVDLMLGPYSSGITMGATAIAEKHNMIMVEAHGASEAIFSRGFKNTFAVLTPASYYTESALKALAAAGAKTAVIAQLDETFSAAAAKGAEQWVSQYGMKLLAHETYPQGITDVSAMLTKFRDLNPDVFVGAGQYKDAVLWVRSAQQSGFAPKAMMLTVGPDSPDFVKELGSAANYIMGDSQWDKTMKYQDKYFGTAADFAARYTKLYNEPPAYQVASSTAAGLVLQLAIEKAGSVQVDAVRQALRSMDIDTFYGHIKFDETGKNIAKPMVTIQVQNGATGVVAPTEYAAAKLLFPMPAWAQH